MRAFRRTFRRPAATPIAAAAANARRSRWRRPNGGGAGKSAKQRQEAAAPGRNAPLAALNPTAIPNEFVAEIDGSLSDAQADALARRHGLVRVCNRRIFRLIGATIGLFRITDGRPVEKVRREFAGDLRRALGAAEFPLLAAAGPEGGVDRGRSRAIRAGKTSIAAGPYAGQRRQRHHRRDRFRNRRQASGTR